MPIRTVLFTALSQVRRAAHPPAQGPRVPPDRRPRRARGLRHRRHGGRRGARPRGGERPAARQGGRRPQEARAAIVRKQPPEGFVGWSQTSFEKLQNAQPEPLTSHFHGHARDAAQRHLPARRRVRRDAAPARGQPRAAATPAPPHPPRHRHLPGAARRRASSRSCRSPTPRAAASGSSATCSWTSRSTSRCRRSRWPRSTCSTGSRRSTRWTSCRCIEATLDDPRPVLHAQQNKARGEAVAAMKADGIEYEERMALLEDVTLPEAARRAAARRAGDLPARRARGWRTRGCRRSRWRGTCSRSR